MAAAASAGRPFDPNRTYDLVLSERLRKEADNETNDDDYELSTLHIDPELKLPSKVTSSHIKPIRSVEDVKEIHLKGAKEGEDYNYTGTEHASQGFVAIFDAASQTIVLDRIDRDYTFNNETVAEGSVSGQSDEGTLNTMIQQEGEPDPDNPYDWRHHLRQRESSSPELEPFDPNSLDALDSLSPNRAGHSSQRQASTPPGEMSARSSSRGSADVEHSEQEFELEIEQDDDRRKPVARQVEDDVVSGEESEEEGGLQIIMDGSTERRKFTHRGRLLGNLDADGPISLRSAANSRSPALPADELSEESDVDVDEMQLNSPVRRDPLQLQPVDDDGDMDEGFDDLEADLEKEFDQDGGGDDGEVESTGGVPIGRYVEASSSESEEE
jgi:hypothetical protein